ncbi:hypothetical protein J6590_064503 [Homalodisca vitripennis]|nr:hypothetical protein J6590_064503 [Homalodisca vitripennis]
MEDEAITHKEPTPALRQTNLSSASSPGDNICIIRYHIRTECGTNRVPKSPLMYAPQTEKDTKLQLSMFYGALVLDWMTPPLSLCPQALPLLALVLHEVLVPSGGGVGWGGGGEEDLKPLR